MLLGLLLDIDTKLLLRFRHLDEAVGSAGADALVMLDVNRGRDWPPVNFLHDNIRNAVDNLLALRWGNDGGYLALKLRPQFLRLFGSRVPLRAIRFRGLGGFDGRSHGRRGWQEIGLGNEAGWFIAQAMSVVGA
jgi:hypothetical protein